MYYKVLLLALNLSLGYYIRVGDITTTYLNQMIKINTSKNKSWEIGAKVNIGFMKDLEVVAVRSEIDDLPDIYTLVSTKGKKYEFIPHNGLYAI